MSNSHTLAVSPFTMPAALAAADSILGVNPTWSVDSDDRIQSAWLALFRMRAALAAGMPEIHSHATDRADLHAAWLRSEGWEAQVTQGAPGDLFLASTLNVVAKWIETGRAYQDLGVDRVLLKKGACVSPAQGNEHPVIEVMTQHPGFTFCFQQVDAAPVDDARLLARAIDMASRSAREAVHLDFPMIDLRVRSDARHMIGLRSGTHVITQAAEQLRLEIDEIGGRASAAAEIAVTRSVSHSKTVKIDGPFVVAVARNGAPDGANKVAFAAYCDRSVWKKPAAGRI
jgi:hypothetical protein